MTLPTIDHHLFTVALCHDRKGVEAKNTDSRMSDVMSICAWLLPSLKTLQHGAVIYRVVASDLLPALSAHYVQGAQGSLALFPSGAVVKDVIQGMLEEVEQIRSEIARAELHVEYGIRMSNELANLSGAAFTAKVLEIRQHFAEDAHNIRRLRRRSLTINMQGSAYTIKTPDLPAYVVQPREFRVSARVLNYKGDAAEVKIIQVSDEDCATEAADLMRSPIPMYRPSRAHVHHAHWFALAALADIKGSLELVVRTGHDDWFSTKIHHLELVEILDVPAVLDILSRATAKTRNLPDPGFRGEN